MKTDIKIGETCETYWIIYHVFNPENWLPYCVITVNHDKSISLKYWADGKIYCLFFRQVAEKKFVSIGSTGSYFDGKHSKSREFFTDLAVYYDLNFTVECW